MSDTTVTPSDMPLQPVKNQRARRTLVWVIVILILLLGISAFLVLRASLVPRPSAGAGVIDTKGIGWVRSIYGTSNLPADLFHQTQAAIPGNDGTIWVTDTGTTSGIMHFAADGRFLGTLQAREASAPLIAPSRMAFGPDGLMYVCETSLDRIHVLRPDGTDGGSFSVPKPVSIAVNGDRIVVGAVSGFAVLDKAGKPMGVVGSRGKGDDQFDYVHGVAFGEDGSIYVADSYNNRISAYEPDGRRRWIVRTGAPSNSASMTNDMLTAKETTDTKLKGSDALQLPLGLTVDGAGRVIVIDMFDCTLAAFDPKTGDLLGKYGDVGAEDGQFFYPVSVSYDRSHDWFTVADAMNRRVQVVRIPGSAAGAPGVIAALNRAAAGPWRACALPFLLLMVALIAFAVWYFRRRRQALAEQLNLTSAPVPSD